MSQKNAPQRIAPTPKHKILLLISSLTDKAACSTIVHRFDGRADIRVEDVADTCFAQSIWKPDILILDQWYIVSELSPDRGPAAWVEDALDRRSLVLSFGWAAAGLKFDGLGEPYTSESTLDLPFTLPIVWIDPPMVFKAEQLEKWREFPEDIGPIRCGFHLPARMGNKIKIADMELRIMPLLHSHDSQDILAFAFDYGGCRFMIFPAFKNPVNALPFLIDRALEAYQGVPPSLTNRKIPLQVDGDTIRWFGQPLDLTPIPKKILSYLCRNPGNPVLRKTIMKGVGMSDGSSSSFKTHLSTIRKALKTTKLPKQEKAKSEEVIRNHLIQCPRATEKVCLNLKPQDVQVL